ncbi:YbaK/EbsC family protein [Aeromicrobium panaciterrae]|uniref:YbaK/EbsC family protein n=1 Tax=Aeromicrobium panaciterrae TaxID=363861 RepID=UPI0031DD1E56
MTVTLGTLELGPADLSLLAPPVADALRALPGVAEHAHTVAIDPALADTASLAAEHDIPPEVSANCVVVLGKRSGEQRAAACVVLANSRADVNGLVRRTIDVRKISFAPQDWAVSETGMEYGGITPVGVPAGWPILVDSAVIEQPWVLLGSGMRRSKLALPGASLADLSGALVLEGLGLPAT